MSWLSFKEQTKGQGWGEEQGAEQEHSRRVGASGQGLAEGWWEAFETRVYLNAETADALSGCTGAQVGLKLKHRGLWLSSWLPGVVMARMDRAGHSGCGAAMPVGGEQTAGLRGQGDGLRESHLLDSCLGGFQWVWLPGDWMSSGKVWERPERRGAKFVFWKWDAGRNQRVRPGEERQKDSRRHVWGLVQTLQWGDGDGVPQS